MKRKLLDFLTVCALVLVVIGALFLLGQVIRACWNGNMLACWLILK